MMRRIDQKDWRCFHLGEIYSVSRPRARSKDDYEPGNVPFVASGSANNGVMKYCEPKENESLDAGDCITVSPVDGSTFYQPIDFLGRGGAGSSVLILRRNGETKETGVFIARSIQQTCSKYTYGHMGNKNSISREQIILPVTESGEPDYHYMVDYVKAHEMELLKKYRAYAKTRVAELGDVVNVLALNKKAWQSFQIKEIADVYSGHDIYAQERIDGPIPLVTAAGTNNGIGYFVGNDNDSRDTGAISVVRNGASVSKAFYHKYSALYGNDCRRIKLKYTNSEFANLFITQVIGMQSRAFSYSRKLGTERLLNLRIMLPVDKEGKPDYSYMEQYAKNVMLRKYRQYLAYLEAKGHSLV